MALFFIGLAAVIIGSALNIASYVMNYFNKPFNKSKYDVSLTISSIGSISMIVGFFLIIVRIS
jgi:hypothetical protein